MTPPTRVFITEDDPTTRAHLVRALMQSENLQVVGEACTLREAITALTPTSGVDVLLTDLVLPDGHGISLIRHARATLPQAMVLVISVFGDELTVTRSILAGASGYLLKDGSEVEVRQAIGDLLEGGSPLSPRVARFVLELARGGHAALTREPSKAEAAATTDEPRLSRREIDVLELLAKGFSPREIAGLLGISAHTVITHSRAIHRKLEVSTRAAAVFEALSLGLIRL